MNANLAALLYLVAGVLFILALRGLSSPASSRQGNRFGMIGMAIAVADDARAAPAARAASRWLLVILGFAIGGGIGAWRARTVQMTAMPQLVAMFHSLVGLAAVLVAAGALYAPQAFGIAEGDRIHPASLIEMSLGLAIGAMTFTGSIIAFLKLDGRMSGAPIMLPQRHAINIALGVALVVLIALFFVTQSRVVLLADRARRAGARRAADHPDRRRRHAGRHLDAQFLFGLGGGGHRLHARQSRADHHRRAGRLVGRDPLLHHVQGDEPLVHLGHPRRLRRRVGGRAAGETETRPVKQGSADDAAFMMKNASKVIIVPGYGMAVAQAQHALREMADILKKEGVEVKYAIHPVAGRMPGHMNVLLAEANVPYDEVFELEDINSEFAQADVAYVIGANDVTNPAAKTDPKSPIYGMPILDVEKAKTVLFVKRGMGSGYAGVENELFFRDNTLMLFGDAKKMTDSIVKALAH